MIRAIGFLSPRRFEDSVLAREIQALLARLRPEVTLQRRHEDRVAVPLLFRLTPLDAGREPICDKAITVVGKDISRRGLSFFHEQPLAYRRAIVSLEHPEFGRFAAEIDINRCRFTKPGWYESGGRLVRSISSEGAAHNESIGSDCFGPHSVAGRGRLPLTTTAKQIG